MNELYQVYHDYGFPGSTKLIGVVPATSTEEALELLGYEVGEEGICAEVITSEDAESLRDSLKAKRDRISSLIENIAV